MPTHHPNTGGQNNEVRQLINWKTVMIVNNSLNNKTMKRIILFLLLICIVCASKGAGQSVDRDTIYVYSDGKILLEYEQKLEQGAKGHREYLENLYKTTLYTLGAIIAVGLFLVSFFGYKTIKSTKNQVDSLFKDKVADIIRDITEEIEVNYKRKLNNYTAYTKHFIADLASQASKGADDSPLYPIDYDNLRGKTILWVDDVPSNNIQHIDTFQTFGVLFILASTTDEAMDKLTEGEKDKYQLIISNLGRPDVKGQEENQKAGIDFLKKLKEKNFQIPVIIYTRPKNFTKYEEEITKLGASITQGYVGLFKEILRNLNK